MLQNKCIQWAVNISKPNNIFISEIEEVLCLSIIRWKEIIVLFDYNQCSFICSLVNSSIAEWDTSDEKWSTNTFRFQGVFQVQYRHRKCMETSQTSLQCRANHSKFFRFQLHTRFLRWMGRALPCMETSQKLQSSLFYLQRDELCKYQKNGVDTWIWREHNLVCSLNPTV